MVTPFQLELRQYVKAVVGGLLAALSLLGGALGDGLSNEEWAGIVGAFLVGFVGVFYAPNKAPVGRPSDPELSEQDGERTEPLINVRPHGVDPAHRQNLGDAGVSDAMAVACVALAAVLLLVFFVLT